MALPPGGYIIEPRVIARAILGLGYVRVSSGGGYRRPCVGTAPQQEPWPWGDRRSVPDDAPKSEEETIRSPNAIDLAVRSGLPV